MKALARQRYLDYLERAGKLPRLEDPETPPMDDDAKEDFEIEDDAVPEIPEVEDEQPNRADFIRALRKASY